MKNSLKNLRQVRLIGQSELADILDVSRQTIHSIETGKYDPSLLLAFKIAHFFWVDIRDVFEPELGNIDKWDSQK